MLCILAFVGSSCALDPRGNEEQQQSPRAFNRPERGQGGWGSGMLADIEPTQPTDTKRLLLSPMCCAAWIVILGLARPNLHSVLDTSQPQTITKLEVPRALFCCQIRPSSSRRGLRDVWHGPLPMLDCRGCWQVIRACERECGNCGRSSNKAQFL